MDLRNAIVCHDAPRGLSDRSGTTMIAAPRVNGKLQVVGDLTLAGVTKSVTLDVDGPTAPQKGMGGKMVIGLSATGAIKRSDFNFAPKMPSMALGDEVQITIDVEANQ